MAIEFAGIGSGEHIDLGNLDLPAGLTSLTIMSWVKFNNFSVPDQRIISKATSSASNDHWFMFSSITSSQMRVRLRTNGTVTTHFENSSSINTGQWYHMGFVYDGSNIIFYRDGVQSGSSAKSGTISTSGSVGVRMADNPGTNRVELDGLIEDCRIYNRALSRAEIETIQAAKGHDDIVSGLLHRWVLNEGPPTVAATGSGSIKDLSGGINGTAINSPVYRTSELNFRRARTR